MLYGKRIIAALIFLCALVAFLIGASYLFVPKNNTAASGMEETSANGILGEQDSTIDVVIIGDSESHSAISPMQIWQEKGYTSYVCGSSAQTLDYSFTMLKRAFRKQKPKIVILETNAIYREMTADHAALTKLGDFLSVFRYHNRWKALNRNDLKGRIEYTWTDDYKGYIYSKEVNACKQENYMKPTETVAHIPDLNLRYVRKIKDYCEMNGAKLVFLSTPSPVNWHYERHNGIAALAKELNSEYIDLNMMNDEIRIDWTKDTRDKGDHLNIYGAKKVTHYLGDYLSRTNTMDDHRKDTKYEKWNEALIKYELAVPESGSQ